MSLEAVFQPLQRELCYLYVQDGTPNSSNYVDGAKVFLIRGRLGYTKDKAKRAAAEYDAARDEVLSDESKAKIARLSIRSSPFL